MRLHVQRQADRELVFGHGNHAARVAIDHRDGRTPVTLAGNIPVAEAPVGGALALAGRFQRVGDGLLGVFVGQAVEFAGVHEHAGSGIGFGQIFGSERRFAFGLDNHDALHAVLLGEVEVALVVGGHGHNRAGAVFGKDEVAEPNRNLTAREGVEAVGAGEDAFFFEAVGLAVDAVHVVGPLDKGAGFSFVGLAADERLDERMLGGQRHESHAKERVGPRGEHLDVAFAGFQRERDLRAHGLADPVALHTEHAVRPAALELGEVGEQFVGVIRDLEEPLGEFLLDDGRVAAPAQAVDDLLVGEHGIAVRAPVLGGFLAVDEALFQPAQEEKLLPAVVGLIAGGDFAVPVIGITEALQLGAHVVDIGVRPDARMDVMLDGGVFGGQAEGVPSHGMHDVESLHTLETRHYVADGVVTYMAHVQVSRRIGKHFQQIVFFFVLVDMTGVGLFVFPAGLPFGFDGRRVIALRLAHD